MASLMTREEYQRHKTMISLVRDQAIDRVSPTGFQHFQVCPMCDARPRKAAISSNGTFYCFVCGKHEIADVCAALGIIIQGGSVSDTTSRRTEKKQPRQSSAYLWQLDPMQWHSRLIRPLDVVARWQAYKPISEQNIMHYQLGWGPLPPYGKNEHGYLYAGRCGHKRLVYANIENVDKIPSAFRGRQVECSCCAEKKGDLKWLTSLGAGAWLHGAAEIERSNNAHIIIAENPIDRLLIKQAMPEVVTGGPTAGAGTWLIEWSKIIYRANPKSVMFWYDNDLIGCPNPETLEILIAEWIAKMIEKGKPPSQQMIDHQRTKAMGPKNAAQLQAMGIHAGAFSWPGGTRPRMDSGQYLIDNGAFN